MKRSILLLPVIALMIAICDTSAGMTDIARPESSSLQSKLTNTQWTLKSLGAVGAESPVGPTDVPKVEVWRIYKASMSPVAPDAAIPKLLAEACRK
jgi:hypothetical protein